MMKRALGLVGVGVLVASVGSIAACGSSSSDENTSASVAALESANVTITLHDSVGNKVGEGAGVLIAPNLVLTSAHLVAGKAKWMVSTADGKKTSVGTRGLTYDWMRYQSLKSHPRKHDVAVIYLDKPIQLAAYPKLATDKQSAGTAAKRVRHSGQTFSLADASLGTVRTFPHAYTTEMSKSETLDTGGAVVNGKGEIVGVVSGRGMQTGKLYIARTDKLVKWLSPKVACAGGAAVVSTGSGIKTYGAPPPKPGCNKDGGSSGSSGSSGGGGDDGSSGSSGSARAAAAAPAVVAAAAARATTAVATAAVTAAPPRTVGRTRAAVTTAPAAATAPRAAVTRAAAAAPRAGRTRAAATTTPAAATAPRAARAAPAPRVAAPTRAAATTRYRAAVAAAAATVTRRSARAPATTPRTARPRTTAARERTAAAPTSTAPRTTATARAPAPPPRRASSRRSAEQGDPSVVWDPGGSPHRFATISPLTRLRRCLVLRTSAARRRVAVYFASGYRYSTSAVVTSS